MKSPVLIVGASLLLAASGCSRQATAEVDPFDVETAVAFERECTQRDEGGNCLQASCKADADSDCTTFAAGCVREGHHYAGTSDGGMCTAVL